jgi:ketosteroid isomerase-like protein
MRNMTAPPPLTEEPSMLENEVRDVVHRYFDCVNNDKWEEFRELWHPECVTTPVDGPQRHGLEDVLAMYPLVLGPFPEHLDDPIRVLVSGDSATVEIHFTGTMHDGKVIEFDALDVFDLQDGLIRRLRYWYDSAPIIAQMMAS